MHTVMIEYLEAMQVFFLPVSNHAKCKDVMFKILTFTALLNFKQILEIPSEL